MTITRTCTARAAAIHYAPLPMPELDELDELDGLIASATFRFELDWLLARRAELKYRRNGHGPTNSSGRARS